MINHDEPVLERIKRDPLIAPFRAIFGFYQRFGFWATVNHLLNRIMLIDHLCGSRLTRYIPTLYAQRRLQLLRKKSQLKPARVSVIIPVYNGMSDGLPRLIASLKAQTHPDLEIIAINSESTDDSVAFLEQHGAVVRHILKKDFRHDTARNLGAEAASGEYLLFTVCDACFDDPQWIKKGLEIMRAYRCVSYCTPQRFDEHAEPYARFLAYNFTALNPHMGVALFGGKLFSRLAYCMASPSLKEKVIHVDDVNHLTERAFFLKHLYRTHTCEDMDYGAQIMRAGKRFAYSTMSSVLHYHSYTNLKKYFIRVLVDLSVINRLVSRPQRIRLRGVTDACVEMGAILLNDLLATFQEFRDDGVTDVVLHGERRDKYDATLAHDMNVVRVRRILHRLVMMLHDRDAATLVFAAPTLHERVRALLGDSLGLSFGGPSRLMDMDAFWQQRDQLRNALESVFDILSKRLGYRQLSLDEIEHIAVLCFLNNLAGHISFAAQYAIDEDSKNLPVLRSYVWQ